MNEFKSVSTFKCIISNIYSGKFCLTIELKKES